MVWNESRDEFDAVAPVMPVNRSSFLFLIDLVSLNSFASNYTYLDRFIGRNDAVGVAKANLSLGHLSRWSTIAS